MNHRTSFLFAVACFAISSLAVAADGRLISDVDLYNFRWIANPQISPDGTKVVYTLVKTTPKHDDYETSLWIIPSAGGPARQLTSGPHDSGAHWSPDGKLVAFTRSVEKEGKSQPAQIYLLSMEGGEALPLTDIPKGASEPIWPPNGRLIAFSSNTLGKDFDTKNEEPSDVRVITTAKYRLNGAGYQEADRTSHIWVVDVPKVPASAVKARQITTGGFSEGDITWSRDSSNIYFTSDRVKERDFQAPDSDIYVVSANGGSLTKVASIDGPIHSLSLSPDGTRVAFIGDINRDGGPARSFSQPDLFVTSTTSGSTPKNLTATYDFDIGGGVGGDQSPPRAVGRSNPYWTPDGRTVIVASAEEGRVNL